MYHERCCERLFALAGGWGCMLMCELSVQKVLGSWDKQRALMAYEGACQVWTNGVTVPQLCYICHPGPCGRCSPLVGCLCGSFVLSVCVSLFLLLLPFRSNQRWKCSGLLVASTADACRHGCRVLRRMLRYATASLVFVLLRCNCAGWSCCIQVCKKSDVMLFDNHTRKSLSFNLKEAHIIVFAICPCIHHHPSIFGSIALDVLVIWCAIHLTIPSLTALISAALRDSARVFPTKQLLVWLLHQAGAALWGYSVSLSRPGRAPWWHHGSLRAFTASPEERKGKKNTQQK